MFPNGQLCCAPGAGFTEGCNGPVALPMTMAEPGGPSLPIAAEQAAVSAGLPGADVVPAGSGRRLRQL